MFVGKLCVQNVCEICMCACLTEGDFEGVPKSVQVSVSNHRVDLSEGLDHVLVLMDEGGEGGGGLIGIASNTVRG